MERTEAPLFPIRDENLNEFKDEVTAYLKSVSYSPDSRKVEKDGIDLSFLIHSKTLGVGQEDEISILKNAVRISDDRIILSNTVNFIINALRDGLSIGRYLSELYKKSSGLETLVKRNKEGSLHQSEQPEFHDKLETQSAIYLFTSAYYIVWRLNDYRSDEVSSINIEFGGVPEISVSRPSNSVQCMLYYYGAYLERSGSINNELEMLKITQVYFERMIEEIHLRKDAFKYLSFFENNHYKLEHSDFIIQGFESGFSSSVHSVTFNKIRMEEIVANREAKHMFKRFAERLLCHDFEEGRNPMLELGGLPSITMGDGRPGTGKSMLIAATATFIQEKADWLGIPFLFWPLPDNIISTYQGGSAERAIEWFRPMNDAHKIIFAPIDDAENNLEDRTRRGVSAGVREFIGVFLRSTEGAYAVNYGNKMVSLFTNIPDQIDRAVLSRVQYRVPIDGAKDVIDFIDQDYLWWSKYEKMMPGLIAMKDPKYKYLSGQQELNSLSESYTDDFKFTQPGVEEVFREVSQKVNPDEQDFFGKFYDRIQDRYQFFSSRDLRNIQKAVDARLIDFDLPEAWWESPETFFKQDYENKLRMLKELMIENMKDVSFKDIRLQEALFYIDTAVRINESGIEREIAETAKEMHIRSEASERLKNGNIQIEN
ncbi:MAG: AAA family ATPase [Chitinophagales bacterium]|nr:AAA family ATPase [Chitinophagales bacterium]